MSAQDLLSQWPVDNVSAAVITPAGIAKTFGDTNKTYALASVTKLLAAYAALVAVEEGAVELDEPAGPEGSTLRHLLAHAAGYEFDTLRTRGVPGERRMYSNTDFEVLGEHISTATGILFAQYAREAVFEPLGMVSTDISKSPAAGGISSVSDLAAFAHELLAPTLLDSSTMAEATSVQFPGISGLIPGYGRHKPNDWGLGFEIRSEKSPHWTSPLNSAKTFGHFGQAGTFLWVDPQLDLACVALTDRPFGAWAVDVWPPFSTSVISEFSE